MYREGMVSCPLLARTGSLKLRNRLSTNREGVKELSEQSALKIRQSHLRHAIPTQTVFKALDSVAPAIHRRSP